MKVQNLPIERHKLKDKSAQDDLIVIEEPLQIQIEFGREHCRYRKNLLVTINSDDPAYFPGYMNENLLRVQEEVDLTKEEITQLVR
ncbi:MAG TPA: hypothetical protein EYQ86_04530, partial [Bacteroidetes bacterium]|nr:hypothetical protein [Bacteroidota bacterium]